MKYIKTFLGLNFQESLSKYTSNQKCMASRSSSRTVGGLTAVWQSCAKLHNWHCSWQGIPQMMQDESYKTQSEAGISSEEYVEEITIEIVQEQLVNNYRPVQAVNDRLVYRTFEFEPRREIRYVVRSDSHRSLAVSYVPSIIVTFTCFIFSLSLSL